MGKLIAAFALALALACSSAPVPLGSNPQSQGNANVQVWVNTDSGVYHCSGTRWYGKTNYGLFMTQRQAQARGYRPAHGSVCR